MSRQGDHARFDQRSLDQPKPGLPTFGTHNVPGGNALEIPGKLVPRPGEGDCWTRRGWDAYGHLETRRWKSSLGEVVVHVEFR